MSNNLVMGLAFGYTVEKVQNFIQSLRQYYDGDVVMITDPIDQTMADYYEKYNVMTYVVEQKFNIKLIGFARWQLYLEVLNEHFPEVENIILSDIRDVVFQDNPFNHLSGADLDFSIDQNTVGNCQEHNAKWIRDIYGEEELERAKDQWILCAGLVAGTKQGIMHLANEFVKETEELIKTNRLTFTDQASMNVMYARGLFPNSNINNDHFRTMHHAVNLTFDRRGYLLNEKGERISVVHCYDRLGHNSIAFIKNALQIKGREGVKVAAEYAIKNFFEWDLD